MYYVVGEQFYFVNWANHTHFSDSFEDCVVMDMHLHNGKWDDRECLFETYGYICQFGNGYIYFFICQFGNGYIYFFYMSVW